MWLERRRTNPSILEPAPRGREPDDEPWFSANDSIQDIVYIHPVVIEVNIHEAKAQLSRLLTRVATGEEVIITCAGKPVARLVPYAELPAARPPGQDEGGLEIAEDFDAPLPEDVLRSFD